MIQKTIKIIPQKYPKEFNSMPQSKGINPLFFSSSKRRIASFNINDSFSDNGIEKKDTNVCPFCSLKISKIKYHLLKNHIDKVDPELIIKEYYNESVSIKKSLSRLLELEQGFRSHSSIQKDKIEEFLKHKEYIKQLLNSFN